MFCAGLVTVKNDMPLLLGEQLRLDGTKDIARRAVDVGSLKGACPAAAASVTLPNGIGTSNQPSLLTADAFDPTGVRTLYKRIPCWNGNASQACRLNRRSNTPLLAPSTV